MMAASVRHQPFPLRPLLAAGVVLGIAGAALRVAPVLAPSPTPVVWACGESLKVAPNLAPQARNSVWTEAGSLVRLHGGRQEYVAFQVVVRGGDAPLENVEVRLTPLRSAGGKELAPDNVDLFRQHYLRVTVPSQNDGVVLLPEAGTGEYPVQMVPLRAPDPGTRFTVPARRNQPVWVDLYVPENQPAGEYQGEAQVLADGKTLETLKVKLTVWGFTLPRETHLKTYLPTGPEKLRWGFGLRPDQDSELRALEDRFFQMAHQHRLNFNPSADDDPEGEWGGRYRGYLDGSAFRERAGAGVGQTVLLMGPGGETEAEVTRHVRDTVSWWKRSRFKAQLALYVYDEPHDDEEFAAVASIARWARSAVGRELPTFLTTTRPNRVPPGLIDIWGEVPAEEIPARQAAGEKFWATNHGYAGGPYVDTPGYAGRSQGWMAWKMKLDGWYFWDCCYWVDRQNIIGPDRKRIPTAVVNANPNQFLTNTWTDPLTFDQKRNPRHKTWIRLNGDGVLFYPGRPVGLREPLASFTMKSLRRGLQDYEYLWLLSQKGKRVDDVVSRVVPKPNEWARDPEAWDQARLELGKRLEEASR
jgi:hypothetical protein